MKLEDVKLGMLVNRVLNNDLFGENPRVVVGFNDNRAVLIGSDGQTSSVYPGFIEPAHYGCSLCKHAHKAYCDIPCAYCRCNANLDSAGVRDKLPDFWEKDEEESEPDDTVQISKNDALLASDQLLRYANVIYACSENVDIEWLRDLAKRIRNGVCE